MTDLLNSRSETPSICCVNLTVQLKLQTQKLGFVYWRLSQYVLSQSCRTCHSVLEVYGWMVLCKAHSDILKSSPSLSASSFKLCCTVRQLRVTHSGNHPRCTLQRRCADALWQPPNDRNIINYLLSTSVTMNQQCCIYHCTCNSFRWTSQLFAQASLTLMFWSTG